MKKFASFAFLVLCIAFGCASRPTMLINVLDSLDRAVVEQPRILAQRIALVDSMRSALPSQGEVGRQSLTLARAYQGLNNDSSIYYYRKALQQADLHSDSLLRIDVLPELAQRLSKAARFSAAFSTLDTLDVSGWSQRQKINYFNNLSHIYIDAANHTNLAFRKKDNAARAVTCLDSLLGLLAGNKGAVSLVGAQKYFLIDEPTLAMSELSDELEHHSPFTPEYAQIAYILASYYKDKPEHADEYAYYLALSALSDARRANGEAVSLMRLGEELLRTGDTDRGSRYLSVASEMIGESNSMLYETEIAPSLSRMAKSWRSREQRSTVIFIITMAVLLAALVVTVFLLLRMRRRQTNQTLEAERLSTSLIDRDNYISQLINLCAAYIESLEEYNRLISRKLKGNQVQDLLKLVESRKLIQDQTERFFSKFDEAINKIYPNFVDEINSLLLADKQVAASPNGRLTPELRIAAFMRLGVTDTAKLAKFLGLSVNTIYTYRNRMKSRAIDRENFEQNILGL